ncbi:cupin domain-containing protein [Natrarchaeobaculum aegyptiacum]|uniref:Cupin n=1 Tax=Natrarchaeobaculum aegyptiacum TaxID=745377 RepID=A0A2Z2HX25_9EURY|nr:cupin domain-containing protein [Natrarchaeobaculum aegyptiacum]ARS91939.1 cupin [Natrarchaeobaculum aegyptiacum]
MGQVNETDLEWAEYDEDDATFRRKRLGEAADSERLGCSLYELPPESRAWPYHYHTANEEALYVLAGSGTLRLDGETHALEAGDFVACPADESGGHRVCNDSNDPLRYLAISTMVEPDVTVYPEREKLGVFVGSPPGGRGERSLHGYYPLDADVDYWESDDER